MDFTGASLFSQLYEIADMFFRSAYEYIEPMFLVPWDFLPRLAEWVYDSGIYHVFPDISGFIAEAHLRQFSFGAFLILMFIGGWITIRLVIFLIRVATDIIDAVLP